MQQHLFVFFLFVFFSVVSVIGQENYNSTFSDNLDGTFTNPVIYADYPDPDIIRVDDDFYMVSSSFTTVPGIPILHSKDLVNWKTIGYAYDRLPNNKAYDMHEEKTMYRGGSWAPCIRYNKGKFYICFCTPSEGFYICISDKPEGPYEMVSFGVELYDPSLLFDDDGKVYVAHGANTIYITELSKDCRSIKNKQKPIYVTSYGTPYEGSHIYKREGWYYITNTTRGYNGIQVCMRSKNIYGPYETMVLGGDDMNYVGCGLHQGGFVDLKNGETWFFIFQDRDYIGRVPVLQPVIWKNGWPYFGDKNNNMKAVITTEKPLRIPSKPHSLIKSDYFNDINLDLQWQWNHNPDNSKWSLSDREGYMRIYSSFAKDLLHARNTLTTKIIGKSSVATVKMDIKGLKDGDVAGVTMFNIPYAWLGVIYDNGYKRLVMCDSGEIIETSEPFSDDILFLRITVTDRGESLFSYSFDNKEFKAIGQSFIMFFTVKTFLGNRYGMFCYNNKTFEGGYCDFDEFVLSGLNGPANNYNANKNVSFCLYDVERCPEKMRVEEKRPHQYLFRVKNDNYVVFNNLLINEESSVISVCANILGGGYIEVREDSVNGDLLAKLNMLSSSEYLNKEFLVYSFKLNKKIKGRKKICFVFKGNKLPLFNLDWFRFDH